MSNLVRDQGSSFYMWNLGKVELYNDSQRLYIEAEINRMKKNPIV